MPGADPSTLPWLYPLTAFSKTGHRSNTFHSMPTAIDRDEVQRLIRDDDGQLVEVLPRDEYDDERLPGAANIPLKTMNRETTAQLDREKPVIVYCYDSQ
jgi:rhodanese-related sulfurtransferase